jgi:hypothetical protein
VSTVEQITKFLERDQEVLPSRVTNGMILLAIREERDARQQENAEIIGKVTEIEQVLHGKQSDRSDGVLNRIGDVEVFQKTLLWLISPVVLAFLSGIGVVLFNNISSK